MGGLPALAGWASCGLYGMSASTVLDNLAGSSVYIRPTSSTASAAKAAWRLGGLGGLGGCGGQGNLGGGLGNLGAGLCVLGANGAVRDGPRVYAVRR